MFSTKASDSMADSHDVAKEAAALAATTFIQEGMMVGIGSGSTVKYFIKHLGDRCRKGLQITAVAASSQSTEQAHRAGIPLMEMADVAFIDIAVDGADEIDPEKRMIKGGGAALLREKIIASSSGEMVIIVDQSKCVELLGTFPLPVEIVNWGAAATISKLERLGFMGSVRRDANNVVVITDNGNLIFDIRGPFIDSPETIHTRLKSIPGVVETGLFLSMAGRVVVGFDDGRVEIRD